MATAPCRVAALQGYQRRMPCRATPSWVPLAVHAFGARDMQ